MEGRTVQFEENFALTLVIESWANGRQSDKEFLTLGQMNSDFVVFVHWCEESGSGDYGYVTISLFELQEIFGHL